MWTTEWPRPKEAILTEGEGPSLFGRDCLKHIHLDWKKIGAITAGHSTAHRAEQLREQYSDIFKNDLGTIHPAKASLSIIQNARPKFCKARTFPYSTRDAVEKELDRLEKEGNIVKIMYSEWATPIVVVPNTDNKHRICGDFKITLNPVLNVDQYTLPKPQDLFATLAGSKKFTKLNLAQAYLRLPLEEESQKCLVIKPTKACMSIRDYLLVWQVLQLFLPARASE